MSPKIQNRLLLAAALGCLILFAAEGACFIGANSQTADEAAHLVAGYSYLLRGDNELNPEYPPLMRALAALPVYCWYRPPLDPLPLRWRNGALWHYGRDFLYNGPVPGDRLLSLARVPNVLLGTALVALVGWWAFRIWGKWAGLLALTLAVLEPNLVAHSSLVTMDLGQTFWIFLIVYLLWEYLERPSAGLLLAMGLTAGAALASKHSAVLLLPMVALLLGAAAMFGRTAPFPWLAPQGQPEPLRRRLAAAGLTLGVLAALAGTFLEAVYGGGGVQTWWRGLKVVRDLDRGGFPAFFMGEYSSEGWWSYFPAAFAMKTPLGSLLLILASMQIALLSKPWRFRDALFLLLPPVLWFAAFAFARINIGLRHVLPVYPFVFVIAGGAVNLPLRPGWLAALALGTPLAGTALSALRAAPHQLAYFNELVGGPEEGYRCLAECNLDWGQELKGLRSYLEREGVPLVYLAYWDNAPPAAYGIRHQYLPAEDLKGPPSSEVLSEDPGRELLAIGALSLQGVHFPDRARYHWLYDRQPIAKIGYSLFVYDVTHDADAHAHLASIYAEHGRQDLAARELRRLTSFQKSKKREDRP
jgi:4-amino-4-deoxy-L-arabinose transferase-like glycosyltransferase